MDPRVRQPILTCPYEQNLKCWDVINGRRLRTENSIVLGKIKEKARENKEESK